MTDREEEGGDGDKRVSLQELYRYVRVQPGSGLSKTGSTCRSRCCCRRRPISGPWCPPSPAADGVAGGPGRARILDGTTSNGSGAGTGNLGSGRVPLSPVGLGGISTQAVAIGAGLSAGRAYDEEFTELRHSLNEFRRASPRRGRGDPPFAQPAVGLADEHGAWPPSSQVDRRPLEPAMDVGSGAGVALPAKLAAAAEVWRICSAGLAIDDWPAALGLMDKGSDPRRPNSWSSISCACSQPTWTHWPSSKTGAHVPRPH